MHDEMPDQEKCSIQGNNSISPGKKADSCFMIASFFEAKWERQKTG